MMRQPLVLVVDDEPMVLKMLETYLKTMQYPVLTAENGEKALQMVLAADPAIEIVLTDIRMPGMDGVFLQKEIHNSAPEIPVIMMTGYSDFDMVVDALRQHTFDLIFKPLEMEQIEWCLKKATQFIAHREMAKNYQSMLEKQVTEQTEAIRIQLVELEEARAIASTVDELKREFLSIVGHELRTPLNGIKGIVHLIEDDHSEENIETFIPLLKESTNKLHGLIENILTLARIKSLQNVNEGDSNTLEKGVRAVLETSRKNADIRKIFFESQIDKKHSSTPLKGPWEAVQAVLGVFIDNAIKFTDPGGRVSCLLKAEPVSDQSDELNVSITVTDSGIGMQTDDLKKIFRPFVQLENFLTRKYSGAGIGLSIAESFAERLGGELSVESDPGKGSRFFCSFKFKSASRTKNCA